MDKLLYNSNMKKVIISKPRGLIHVATSKPLSALQKRMYNLFLFKLKQRLNYIEKTDPKMIEYIQKGDLLPYVIVSIEEMRKIINLAKRNNEYIIELIKELKEIEIEYNIFNKDENKIIDTGIVRLEELEEELSTWGSETLIAFPQINFKTGEIRVYMSPTAVQYVLSPNFYLQFNLLISNFLTSSYAMNLYEYLNEYYVSYKAKNKDDEGKEIQTGFIELSKLQDLLGLKKDHSYRQEYKHFKRLILNKAIKELNEENIVSFYVEVEEKKRNRKVVALNFIIKPKPFQLLEDVFLTDNGYEKIKLQDLQSYMEMKEKIEEIKKEEKDTLPTYPISDDVFKIKEKLLNDKEYKFSSFLKDLRDLKETFICNNVEGYLSYMLLKANKFGFLEIYNPKTDKTIELDNTEVNKIRRWLYENPDVLGKIEEIDIELEEMKKDFIGRYYQFKENGLWKCVKITDIQKKDGYFIIKGNEIIENEGVKKLTFKEEQTEKLKLSLKDEFSLFMVEDYRKENQMKKEEELIEFFNQNKDKLDGFVEYIENKSIEISKELTKAENKADEEEYQRLAKELEENDTILANAISVQFGDERPTLKMLQCFKNYILEKF